MTHAAGTRLVSYEILSALGAGAMGEVYRARDTKLGRDVAIKILPADFALDRDRVARFTREAQILASLNHPNIAGILHLEETDGVSALVMELVEGETLADRISRGAIPLDEALPIARQICDALEAAHEQGITHRDLKPANIKVTPDGVVKVLDFGLAKLADSAGSRQQAAGSVHLTMSPTITSPAMMTGVGVLLGTAAYMAPEQAKGRPADKRSDIWAFGCVLYEMLTGKRPFDGEDITEVLGAVVRLEPEWEALPADLAPTLQILLKRCLQKDRRQRIGDISTAQFLLNEPASLVAALSGSAAPVIVHPRSLWRRAVFTAAAVVVGSVITGTIVWLAVRSTTSSPRVTRLTITPPSAAALSIGGSDRDLAITPDGSRLIYVGSNGTQLFVRALEAIEPVAIFKGAPRAPFLSPDGQWVGFVDETTSLKKVAMTGGPAVKLADMISPSRGATWAPDDTIIFATTSSNTGLQRVSAAGGPASVLTRPDRALGEASYLWPEMLPGGRAVLFTITAQTGGLDSAQIAVLDLQTGARKVLLRGGSHAHYVPSGHLMYAAAGTLRAVAFDPARLETHGTPVPVVPDVLATASGGVDAVVADDGTLAYVSGGGAPAQRQTLAWVDRQGKETPIPAPPRAYRYARLSPDGTRVALDVRDEQNDIWVWDLARHTLTRLTFDPGLNRGGVWTPDGRRIVFSAVRDGGENLYWQMADGSGTPEQLTKSERLFFPTSFSPDGTRLVFDRSTPPYDIAVLTLDGERQIKSLLQTPFNEMSAEVSPDGRWLAYQSNESGRPEVYVRPFPDVNAGRWQISTDGGTRPMWARSGRELFYLVAPPQGGAIDKMIAVPIQPGSTFAAGPPQVVFTGPYVAPGDSRTYDVTRDGQRFLMIKDATPGNDAPTPRQLVVVQNWGAELKRLVPGR